MITYSPYRPSDAHAAVDLWSVALGDDFPLDLRTWRQNVDQCPRTIAEASLIARDDEAPQRGIVGLLIVKSPKNIGVVAVHPDYRRQGIGTEMVAMARQTIGSDAAASAKWVAGQDYNHFFPGVPDGYGPALAFFASLGFQRGERLAHDVRRSLQEYTVAPEVRARIGQLREDGIVIGPCAPRDLSALAEHIAANYSQRWLADTITRLNTETTPAEIIIAQRAATGEVVGFAHTYSSNSRYVGPSILWRALLGPKYGGLGPMGVDKSLRHQGLGLALLSAAVESVKERGATDMAIDWTELVGFYAKCGFEPWKSYVPMREA